MSHLWNSYWRFPKCCLRELLKSSGWVGRIHNVFWIGFFSHCLPVGYKNHSYLSCLVAEVLTSPAWKKSKGFGWNEFEVKNLLKGAFFWGGNSPTASWPFCSFALAGMSRPRLFNMATLLYTRPWVLLQFSWFWWKPFLVVSALVSRSPGNYHHFTSPPLSAICMYCWKLRLIKVFNIIINLWITILS